MKIKCDKSAPACRDCGTQDPRLHYRSGKMGRCYDCQNFKNLLTKTTGGVVDFSREEFIVWKRSGPRECHYCGIAERDIYDLGVINVRTKKTMESIGVDRRDNNRPYTLDNLVLCCPPCNAIKGSILTDAEMEQIGPHIRSAWNVRLSEGAKNAITFFERTI